LLLACLPAAAQAVQSPNPFEIVPGSFHFTQSTPQAGAHSDWTTSFDLAHSESGPTKGTTYNEAKDTVVELPRGFIGDSTTVPTCSASHLLEPNHDANRSAFGFGANCPGDTQVGTITLDLTIVSQPERWTFPVYNIASSSPGVAAELGFHALLLTQLLPITVRPGDSGLTVTTPDIEGGIEVHDISVTIWGVPNTHAHDHERGRECLEEAGGNPKCNDIGGEEVHVPAEPFLTNPTSCGPFTANMKADSWETAGAWSEASTEVSPVTECDRVHFDPSIETRPSTKAVESPTGLEVSLLVPQTWEDPFGTSTSNLKDAKVVLPQGFTINPSAGSGLGACTPQQYEAETAQSLPGAGCPPESKIGSIEIDTPLLSEKIFGAVYVATPYDNPFGEPGHPSGSLLALYIVAKNPQRGILVKVAGQIELNPVTGQLSTTFLNNPQVAFNRFTLKFRPGATAPLVSPPACGTYTTQAALTPWSAPLEPRLVTSRPFEITQGVREGQCPSGGVPPFHPQVVSGTQNNAGGSYSPFYLRILREDGEQEITRFSTTLPPGLTGNLSGIPFCPDVGVEAAKARAGTPHGGAEEEADPSCPAASEIGHTIVEAGVGTVLAQTPGKIYLAGPYHGAPLSIVSITSAKVGPFDLGTVVIRFALDINPSTAQVEVSANGSDPIPHIIEGIVIHVRDIRVYMNRANFILNPTNCTALALTNTINGAGADPANPAGQVPVTVTTPFTAANCSSLQFKPAFSVSTQGKTSKAQGASLTTKLAFPSAPQGTQANITKVKVELPKQLPSRLTTLQKACLAATFEANPAACPAGSVVGHAKAVTPVLPVPLEGPAYFVSHGGEAFPSLIVVLQGYGITVDLVGATFIDKHGVTSTTFNTVPDVPVGTFELTLPQGPYSALAANTNLCALTTTTTVKRKVTQHVHGHTLHRTITTHIKKAAGLVMPTFFWAQNGAQIHQNTPIAVTGCPKAKKAKKARKARRARRSRRR
jgi:hypothetical protein